MRRGEVSKGVVLLGTLLLMSACTTHIEPKVAMEKESKIVPQKIDFKVKEKINLTQEVKRFEVESVKVESVEVETFDEIEEVAMQPVIVEPIALTTLSANVVEEKNWVPLKVEDEIEWNAESLLGLPYVWGATGPNSYDCSGFTRKIYGDVGIKLPRVSREQAKKGEFVSSIDELRKGDMVFFATKRHHPKRVTHVGIYLGNGNFIHASSGAKKVVICNFKRDTFYKRKFLWGRRVLQDQSHVASFNAKHFKSEI